jgi:hypothetical protein
LTHAVVAVAVVVGIIGVHIYTSVCDNNIIIIILIIIIIVIILVSLPAKVCGLLMFPSCVIMFIVVAQSISTPATPITSGCARSSSSSCTSSSASSCTSSYCTSGSASSGSISGSTSSRSISSGKVKSTGSCARSSTSSSRSSSRDSSSSSSSSSIEYTNYGSLCTSNLTLTYLITFFSLGLVFIFLFLVGCEEISDLGGNPFRVYFTDRDGRILLYSVANDE